MHTNLKNDEFTFARHEVTQWRKSCFVQAFFYCFSARCLLCFFGYGLAGNYILIAVLTYCISKSAAVFVSYNKKALILRAFCHLPGFAYLTRCPKFVKLTTINYVSLFAVLMDYEQYACKRFAFFKLLYFSRHKMKLVQN